jgi:hypothetical protein
MGGTSDEQDPTEDKIVTEQPLTDDEIRYLRRFIQNQKDNEERSLIELEPDPYEGCD